MNPQTKKPLWETQSISLFTSQIHSFCIFSLRKKKNQSQPQTCFVFLHTVASKSRKNNPFEYLVWEPAMA